MYRWVKAPWIDSAGKVINIPGPSQAVDLPCCSVDRSVFTDAAGALARGGSEAVAVAALAVRDVPAEFRFHRSEDVYESVVFYCPTDTNNAHTEIRTRKVGGSDWAKPSSAGFKSLIRDEIAAQLRIVYRPATDALG